MARRKTWAPWATLLIALAAILPYLGTLQADFVWDDDLLVVDDAYDRAPALLGSLFARHPSFSPNDFRPLGLLTFFADLQLYGFRPWGYHLTNVLLHALVSVVAYLLLRRLLDRWPWPELGRRPIWLPFGLALLFAWHPVHVEAVSFVAGRFDLLCTLFYLLGLLLDLAACEVKSARRRLALATGTGLAFLLALGAKEMAVTFPLALAACYAWRVSRLTPRLSRFTHRGSCTWPVLFSLVFATIAYLGLRISGLGYLYLGPSGAGLPTGNLLQHLLLVGRSVTRYLRLLAFPWHGLSPIHHADLPLSAGDPLNWLALGLILGLLGALAWLLRRRVATAWPWLAFAVALLPMNNLMLLEIGGGAFICERFAYLPSFFFLAAVGASGQTLRIWEALRVSNLSYRRGVGAALVAALAVACLAGVLVTAPHWRDDVALWTWASQRAPGSDLPWVNLAVQAGNQGEAEQALEYANRALALNPDNPAAYDAAGLALFLLGDPAGAEEAFRNGLALAPDDGRLHNNLGMVLR